MEERIKKITQIINGAKEESLIIAIDGRCASGKTTLASELAKSLDCNLFHMDDFFLRPEQRTKERLNLPGGNIDHERFLCQVLLPLKEGKAFSFRPFNCASQSLDEEIYVTQKRINIVEGSYSCHPMLWENYDIRFFLKISPEEQMNRILQRNGAEGAEVFKNKWIPLEEKYFSAFHIESRCDYSL